MIARCVARVGLTTAFYRTRQCSRDAKEGSNYCAQHSPVARMARRDATQAKWNAEHRRTMAKNARLAAAFDIVRQLALLSLHDIQDMPSRISKLMREARILFPEGKEQGEE